jgi:hypothetical protein
MVNKIGITVVIRLIRHGRKALAEVVANEAAGRTFSRRRDLTQVDTDVPTCVG